MSEIKSIQKAPSIHLTVHQLAHILADYIDNPKGVAKAVLRDANQFSLQHRRAVSVTQKTVKKAKAVMAVPKEVIEGFAGTLREQRLARHHKGIPLINKEHHEYSVLVQVTELAMNFCKDFDLSYPIGFEVYIDIALNFMPKSYGINRFKTYHQRTINYYQAMTELSSDSNKDATDKMVKIWQDIVISRDEDYKIHITPEQRVNLLYAREAADDCRAKYYDWLQAQFAGLDFLTPVPEFSQFHGESAITRYQKYMLKGKAKVAKEEEDHPNITESERAYFARLKQLNAK